MITGLSSAFFLAASFIFFLIVIGVLGLSAVMRPIRWNERQRGSAG